MTDNLLIIILNWLPIFFFGAVFLLALFKKFNFPKLWKLSFHILIGVSIIFRVFYAAFLTFFQYYVWSQNKFTQMLLNAPLDETLPSASFPFSSTRLGYFLFYSYGRFWLNVLVSIGAAFIFYLFLKFLQKHRERFFEEGETELGFLTALIVGWPNFIIFLPLVFVSVVLISVFRRIFLKEEYTTLGWPFFLATLVVLIFGNKLIQLLDFGVLKI